MMDVYLRNYMILILVHEIHVFELQTEMNFQCMILEGLFSTTKVVTRNVPLK